MRFKVGDKVRIIQRKPGNTSGCYKDWNKPNGNVGLECVVKEKQKNYYTLYHEKNYVGLFDDNDIEFITKPDPIYEIY